MGAYACSLSWRILAHTPNHAHKQIISLGIGDTTEPLPKYIADAMAKAAAGLATREGYSGCVGVCCVRGGGEGLRARAQ